MSPDKAIESWIVPDATDAVDAASPLVATQLDFDKFSDVSSESSESSDESEVDSDDEHVIARDDPLEDVAMWPRR